MSGHLDYTPPPTVRDWMVDESILKVLVGPLGSGKSMGALMELFRRACAQEPDANGVRPTRFVIVRNTAQQLRETTLADAKQYFPFAAYLETKQTMRFRERLADNTYLHSDWIFLPLERPEDVRKLLSLNLTGGFIEECREIQYGVVHALLGRIGRYPMKARVHPTWQGILCVSNPWPEGSDWHENLVIDKPEDWSLYRQPGGLDANAENREWLPDDYYERLIDGATQGWIDVHVHALWGEDQSGQAVYRATFDKAWHVTDRALAPNPQRPVLVGIDFGRSGAAVICQESIIGQLIVFEELLAEARGLPKFLEDLVLPALRERYWQCPVFVVGDPAGQQTSKYSEQTAFDILEDYDLKAVPAPTNDPHLRINAVEKRLMQSIGREPSLLISGPGCPVLVRGAMHGYRFKRKGYGGLNLLPEKNDYSHPHDALQYACLGAQSEYVGRTIMRTALRGMTPRPRRQAPFSPRAWT